MIKEKEILIIGDLHGEDSWKLPLEYFLPNEVETNIDKYDFIVFMGDYVDSFTKSNEEIRKNLIDIIELKLKYPEKVILLLGNHELQYLFDSKEFSCSGYRTEMKYDLFDILNRNKNLFQVSFEIHSNTDKYIFTHAGIHRGFYNIYIKQHDTEETLSETLNNLYPNYKALFHVSWYRGGIKKEGGIFWADKIETYTKPLKGYHQIIGHTHTEDIKYYNNYGCDKTSTIFVDCMPIYHELKLNVTSTSKIHF
jgi:predicted MPP superfamily phosphohydrolase